jgi:lysozyme family protein
MRFEHAVNFLLRDDIEGAYVDDPQDTGRETKYGISKKSYPHLDIRNLTKLQAIEIYRADFWELLQCDHLPNGLDLLIFDAAVNHGPGNAIRLLQEAVGFKGKDVDGVMGPKTRTAAWTIHDIAEEYAARRMFFYGSLAKFPHNGLGWSRRLVQAYMHAMDRSLDNSKSWRKVDSSGTEIYVQSTEPYKIPAE